MLMNLTGGWVRPGIFGALASLYLRASIHILMLTDFPK